MGFSKDWPLLLPRSGGDFAVIPGAEAGVAKRGSGGGEMESLIVLNESNCLGYSQPSFGMEKEFGISHYQQKCSFNGRFKNVLVIIHVLKNLCLNM